jgi:lipopolysaccharide transport system ATP-binding protein
MPHPAIRVRELSKHYRLGAVQGPAYHTLRDQISDWCYASLRKVWRRSETPSARRANNSFWALRDISFDVQPGEIVGVVGRNGAGKSTFLKILSRITEPTSGRVEMYGRVGSLLEVGTGFHPELTGRENIYLNGAILGMSRREIQRKFDDIVEFAEIGRFLDTPVKRYSSGMYVRLAFAVASHLEPEILIVDEVLAVGDAQFQQKCLGRMNEVRRDGRTVLFVSHNMAAVRSLCTRALLLEKGKVVLDGGTAEVVDRYLQAGQVAESCREIPVDAERMTNGQARMLRIAVCDIEGQPVSQLYYGQPFRVTFACELFEDLPDGHFEVSVSNTDGTHILYSTTIDGGRPAQYLAAGRHEVTAQFDTVLLPRRYLLDIGVHRADGTTLDFVPRACAIDVQRLSAASQGHYPWPTTRGHVAAHATWRSDCITSL